MGTLLVISAGQTDVQLVVDGERQEFDKDNCARLHVELESRRNDLTIVDSSSLQRSQHRASQLPSSHLRLCTPKLDAVLKYVQNESKRVTHALVLDTRRDPGAERGEPRFAGHVLERRLREGFGVTPAICTYLTGQERLEDRGDQRDAIVRRTIVNRINDAMQMAMMPALASPSDGIFVAGTGGPPQIADLIEEIACLHAGGVDVHLLEVADPQRAGGRAEQAVRKTRSSPHAALDAKRHALQLVRKGHFVGAWGAVQHLPDDENEWTRVVHWLYQWASSLPLDDVCDMDVLKDHRGAVRAALRVEFALRARDIPRAVHGTVAFFEAALRDHLNEYLEPHPHQKRTFKIKKWPDTAQRAKLIRETNVGFEENRKRPFEEDSNLDDGPWYLLFQEAASEGTLVKHFLGMARNSPLGRLSANVNQVRNLRNDVAHDNPTPKRMKEAHELMQAAGLWSPDNMFLCQNVVADVLRELNVKEPEALANDLVGDMERRLLAHRYNTS